MYPVETLYLIALCGPVLGLVAGYLFAKRRAPSALKQRQLQQQVEQLTLHQQQYQQQVSDHFSETAELVNTMTNSYQNVHQHLAQGAQLLAAEHGDTALIALGESRSDQDPAPLAIEQDLEAATAGNTATDSGLTDADGDETAAAVAIDSDDIAEPQACSATALETAADKSAQGEVKALNSEQR